MKRYILQIAKWTPLLCLAVTFTACSSDDDVLKIDDRTISFEPTIGLYEDGTRVTNAADYVNSTVFPTTRTFGIIVDTEDLLGNQSTLIDKEEARYNATSGNGANRWACGTAYSPERQYLWPIQQQELSVYAYWPKTLDAGTFAHTTGTAPTFTYQVPADADQQDILACKTTYTRGDNTSTSIPLQFQHLLTAICFKASGSIAKPGTINSIKLVGFYNTGTFDMSTMTWGSQNNTSIVYERTINQSLTANKVLIANTAPILMLPQQFPNNARIVVNFTFKNSANVDETRDFECDLSDITPILDEYGNRVDGWTGKKDMFEAGTRITYTITITSTTDMNISYTLTNWAEGSTDAVAGDAQMSTGS